MAACLLRSCVQKGEDLLGCDGGKSNVLLTESLVPNGRGPHKNNLYIRPFCFEVIINLLEFADRFLIGQEEISNG